MAIDTERKRKSVPSIARPWHPAIIVPDGDLDSGDRGTIGRGGGAIIPPGGAPAGSDEYTLRYHNHYTG